MSVISVTETWNGRQGGVDQSALRRYVRVFRVITNDPLDGVFTVGNDPGLPKLYDAYIAGSETDLLSRVSDIRPMQSDEDPRVWEVQVQYDGAQDPFTQPPQVEWGFTSRNRVIELDQNGQPLLNSAGQFFDPPPEDDDNRLTCSITVNQATFDPAAAFLYQNAINSDALIIANLPVAPGQAKVNVKSTYNQNYSYVWWATTYNLEFQYQGWTKQILDQGRYQSDGDGGLKECTAKDSDGNTVPVDDPVPLDGSGKQLANPSPLTAKKLTFFTYRELPFSVLGLPAVLP